MSEKSKLSGVHIRFKNPHTGEMEERVFEYLPESDQQAIVDRLSKESLKEIVMKMAKSLHSVVEELKIYNP